MSFELIHRKKPLAIPMGLDVFEHMPSNGWDSDVFSSMKTFNKIIDCSTSTRAGSEHASWSLYNSKRSTEPTALDLLPHVGMASMRDGS